MTRRSPLRISAFAAPGLFWGLSLGLLACSAQDAREQQCKGVVERYIQLLGFTEQQFEKTPQTWRLSLSFQVRSALGPQPGQASCEYAVAENGAVSDKPYAITLGNTRHTGSHNIDDLLAGRFADGLPADVGHH